MNTSCNIDVKGLEPEPDTRPDYTESEYNELKSSIELFALFMGTGDNAGIRDWAMDLPKSQLVKVLKALQINNDLTDPLEIVGNVEDLSPEDEETLRDAVCKAALYFTSEACDDYLLSGYTDKSVDEDKDNEWSDPFEVWADDDKLEEQIQELDEGIEEVTKSEQVQDTDADPDAVNKSFARRQSLTDDEVHEQEKAPHNGPEADMTPQTYIKQMNEYYDN